MYFSVYYFTFPQSSWNNFFPVSRLPLSQEKVCLECKLSFPILTMIKGTKSNPYGDKTYSGHFCLNCVKNRARRRSKILLGFSLGLTVLAIILFGLSLFINFYVSGLLAEQYFSTLELFLQMGIIFLVFALVMMYIRSRETKKMKAKIRLIKY